MESEPDRKALRPGRGRADAYADLARAYDLIVPRLLRPGYERMAALCLEMGCRRILDVGCGTGALAFFLAARTPCVVGLERSPAMARRFRKRLAAGRYPGHGGPPLCVMGDGTTPPFAPQSFDMATLCLALHETDAPERLLGQALSLAPRVLVLEWRMPERNLDCLLTAWVPVLERLAGKEHFRAFRRFMAGGAIRGLAGRCGARIVREEPLAAGSLVLALVEGRTPGTEPGPPAARARTPVQGGAAGKSAV